MRSTSLRRARSWTVGVMAATAVATAITGYHLAADHSAALAAGTSNPSDTSRVVPAQHRDDDGFTLFGDEGREGDEGDEGGSGGLFGSGGQVTPGFPNNQGNQGTQSQNGFSSPGQRGSGAGTPHVMSHGS